MGHPFEFFSRVITPSLERKRIQVASRLLYQQLEVSSLPRTFYFSLIAFLVLFYQVLKHMVTSRNISFFMIGVNTLPLWRYFV